MTAIPYTQCSCLLFLLLLLSDCRKMICWFTSCLILFFLWTTHQGWISRGENSRTSWTMTSTRRLSSGFIWWQNTTEFTNSHCIYIGWLDDWLMDSFTVDSHTKQALENETAVRQTIFSYKCIWNKHTEAVSEQCLRNINILDVSNSSMWGHAHGRCSPQDQIVA